MRHTGEVTRVFPDRGFAFVTEDRRSYFLHFRSIRESIVPRKGDKVTFEIQASDKPGFGPQCMDAEIIMAESEPKAGA